MNKRVFAFVLTLALVFCLGGCQSVKAGESGDSHIPSLAKPDGGETTQAGRLVGVFVTREYLDLFDMESYLEDNWNKMSGGQIKVEDGSQYQDRIYAQRIEESHTDSTGQQYKSCSYKFPDLEGAVLASYRVDDGNVYYTSDAGDWISDVHIRQGGKDAGVSGTIFVASNTGTASFYLNPVYQTADGQVYLMGNNGGVQVDSHTGGEMTQTVTETVTVTENGETIEQVFTAKVTVDFINPAKTVTVIQMDKNDREITREQFSVEDLPEEYIPERKTAYLIVCSDNGVEVSRQIFQQEDGYITVAAAMDSQICTKKSIAITW